MKNTVAIMAGELRGALLATPVQSPGSELTLRLANMLPGAPSARMGHASYRKIQRPPEPEEGGDKRLWLRQYTASPTGQLDSASNS